MPEVAPAPARADPNRPPAEQERRAGGAGEDHAQAQPVEAERRHQDQPDETRGGLHDVDPGEADELAAGAEGDRQVAVIAVEGEHRQDRRWWPSRPPAACRPGPRARPRRPAGRADDHATRGQRPRLSRGGEGVCPRDVAPTDVVGQLAVDPVEDAQLCARGIAEHEPDAGEQSERVGRDQAPEQDAAGQAHRHGHEGCPRRATPPGRAPSGGTSAGSPVATSACSRVGHDLSDRRSPDRWLPSSRRIRRSRAGLDRPRLSPRTGRLHQGDHVRDLLCRERDTSTAG